MYKLLIIDDEPLIIDGLKKLLPWKKYGIRICGHAHNGEKGLEKIDELKPDIVITDIRMPKRTGLDLIAEIKKSENRVYFIILSGYEDFEYLQRGITLGVENYLLKPVNEEELASTISLTVQKIEKNNVSRFIQREGISILRENILYRWALGLIGIGELEERATLLRIPLTQKSYSCGLVHCTEEEAKAVVFDKIRRHIRKGPDSDSTFNPTLWMGVSEYHERGDLLLCFSGPDEGHGESRKTIIDSLLSKLTERERDFAIISLGKIENSPSRLKDSFDSALGLQKYSLLIPEKTILQTEESLQSSEEPGDFKKMDLSQLFFYVRNRDRPGLNDLITAFFQSLKELNDPYNVQHEVINLLLELDHFCEQIKLDESILRNRRQDLIQKILFADTMDNLREILMETLERLMRILDKKEPGQNPIIRKVLFFINENLQDDVSLKRLGYEFKLNSNYLGQVFKKETGESYKNYVNNLKMQTARKMLQETSKTAAEIAANVGFSDPNYFSRFFKDMTGCTPTEFRSRFRE